MRGLWLLGLLAACTPSEGPTKVPGDDTDGVTDSDDTGDSGPGDSGPGDSGSDSGDSGSDTGDSGSDTGDSGAGDSGAGDSGAGAAPTATIVDPPSGSTLPAAPSTRLSGTVADADDAATSLRVTWSVDTVVVCPETTASAGGNTTCDVALTAGAHTVRLDVVDPSALTGEATIPLTVAPNAPPTAVVVTPASGGTSVDAGTPVTVQVRATDAEDAAADLAVSWSSSLVGDDLSALSTVPDGADLAGGTLDLASGTRTLTATVRDRLGAQATAAITVTVGPGNLAPRCTLDSPKDDAVLLLGQALEVAGRVTDLDDGASALAVEIRSDKDGLLATPTPSVAGSVTASVTGLSTGVHLITMGARDPDDATCSDTATIRVGNPPTLVVTAPGDGDVVDLGDAVPVAVAVTDPDGDVTTVAVEVRSDRDGLVASGAPDAGGSLALSLTSLSRGTHALTLSATDSDAFTTSVPRALRVNGPPGLATIEVSPAYPKTTDTLAVQRTVDAVDADGDPVTHTTWWTRDPDVTVQGASVDAAQTTKGQTWTAHVRANDGRLDGAEAVQAVTVANTPPVLTKVWLAPETPRTGDELQLAWTGSDADDDALLPGSIVWRVDGTEVAFDTTLFGPVTQGTSITVTLQLDDGEALSAPLSATVSVGNAAPEVAGAHITPPQPSATDTLTCVADDVSDPENDAVTLSYTWAVDGTPTGDTTATVDASGLPRKASITCGITPFDGTTEGLTTWSDPVSIDNRLPVVLDARLEPANPTVGDTVAVVDARGDDPDGDPVTLAYAWKVGGVPAGSGPSLVLAPYAKGQLVQVSVTASDGAVGPATSLVTTIANTPPVATEVVLSPAAVSEGDTVTATPSGTDADDDRLDWTYTWTVGPTVLQDGPLATLAAPARGSVLRVTVSAWDGEAASATKPWAEITVGNAVPTVASAEVGPPGATVLDALTCTPVGWSDADGDPEGYRFSWTVDDVPQVETTDTLPAGTAARGDVVRCTVAPDDGTDVGAPVTSPPLIVDNAPPSVRAAHLEPDAPKVGDTVEVVVDTTHDPDGDTVTVDVAWFVDDQPAGTGSALELAAWHKGQVVRAVLTPRDDADSGLPFDLDTVIANTPPVALTVVLEPSDPVTGVDITAVPTGDDADSDHLTWTYVWSVDGTEAQRGPADTFVGTRGDEVSVEAWASDGEATSGSVQAGPVEVGNAPPVLTEVKLSPSAPTGSSTLTCIPEGWYDAEGDTPDYRYAWTIVDGSPDSIPTDVTTDTFPASRLDVGEAVWCTVTPFDGEDEGAPVSSPTVARVNVPPVITRALLTPEVVRAGDVVQVDGLLTDDADGDTVTVSYAWTLDGEPVGDDSSELPLDTLPAYRGDVVRVVVTPHDGREAGTPWVGEVTLANTPPVLHGISFDPSPPATRTEVTALVDATDADQEELTITYRWRVNGGQVLYGPYDTLQDYLVTAGSTVRVEVVVSDGSPDIATGFHQEVVGNGPPELLEVYLAPEGIKTQQGNAQLTCSARALDPEQQTLVFVWDWYINGEFVYRGDGQVWQASGLQPDDEVYCIVTVTDPGGLSDSLQSNTAKVANRPPQISLMILEPDYFFFDSEPYLVSPCFDPDGDKITRTFEWFIDDVLVATVVDDEHYPADGGYFDRGSLVWVHLSITDGQEVVEAWTEPRQVLNYLPEFRTFTFDPARVVHSFDQARVRLQAGDEEGDSVDAELTWSVNGTEVATHALTNVTSTRYDTLDHPLEVGDVVSVHAWLTDSYGGRAQQTIQTTVVNNPPERTPDLDVLPVDDQAAADATAYRCDPGTDVDQDGDPVTWTFSWAVDGVAWQGSATTTDRTGDTLPTSAFALGSVLSCAAVPDDGHDAGAAWTAFSVAASDLTIPQGVDITQTLGTDQGESVVFVRDLHLSDGTLELLGKVTLVAHSLVVDHADVLVTADGTGELPDSGPGAPTGPGAGAGHGAAGGAAPDGTPGGVAYGSSASVATVGSGGGSGAADGGTGGGALEVIAHRIAVTAGSVRARGEDGASLLIALTDGAGGGGSGGTVRLRTCSTLEARPGSLDVSGGDGGDATLAAQVGSGGAGGRVKLVAPVTGWITGPTGLDVNGGAAGVSGVPPTSDGKKGGNGTSTKTTAVCPFLDGDVPPTGSTL